MSVNSGRNSDSTLWGALKQRLSRIGRRSKEHEKGLNRGWTREDYDGPVRSFESHGYAKHELPSGSEIYLATLEDDLFFEFDEPKPSGSGGRFADEALNLIKPKIREHEVIFSGHGFSAPPQMVSTSSKDAVRVEVPEGLDYDDRPEYELKPFDYVPEVEACSEDSVDKTDVSIDVERLPAAPVCRKTVAEPESAEAKPAEITEDIAMNENPEEIEEPGEIEEPVRTEDSVMIELEILLDEIAVGQTVTEESAKAEESSDADVADEEPVRKAEKTFVRDFDRSYDGPILFTRRYPELMSPAELPALPQEIEYSTCPNPPGVILLPEAKDFPAMHGSVGTGPVRVNAMASASTCDIEYTGTLQRYEAFDSTEESGESSVAVTSSIENCLVDYAEFAGYDFLPEATEPVRREPRKRTNLVSGESGIEESENKASNFDSDSDPKYEITPISEIKPKISFMFGSGNQLHNFY